MQLHNAKATLTGIWVLIVTLAAVMAGFTSVSRWAAFAVLATIPPAVFWQVVNAPAPSMSESIRGALKD